jgi:hypothetical protein
MLAKPVALPHSAISDGPDAFQRFDAMVGLILSVPREELARREAEYKAKAALNPHKRGPKPKQSSVSPAPGGSIHA